MSSPDLSSESHSCEEFNCKKRATWHALPKEGENKAIAYMCAKHAVWWNTVCNKGGNRFWLPAIPMVEEKK